jgi:hypothetical protein
VFFPRTAALTLTRDEIRELRLSLNTPVVATEELPIGPARAAILVHDDADGGPQVTIGIRSLRADRVVLYAFEGDLREASSFAVAVDAALSFAESMGFLFDEDELGAGGAPARVRCLGLWREFLGEDALGVPPARAAEPEPAEELLLDELAEDSALDEATDAPVFLSGDEAEASAGATDVFVPQFEGDLGLPGDEPPGFESALAFDPDSSSAHVEFDAESAPDEEASFAGLLDPTDEPAAGEASDESGETAGDVPPRARARRPAAGAPLVSLTKFRAGLAPGVAAPAPAPLEKEPPAPGAVTPAEPQRTKALGKLRLIRRLRGAGAGRKRHPILRLFGSF